MNGITKMIFRNLENTMTMINNLFELFSKNSMRNQYFQNIFCHIELDMGYDLEIPE